MGNRDQPHYSQEVRFRVRISGTLLSAMTSATMFQFALGVLAAKMILDLSLQATAVGVILSCVYVTGAVGSLFAGVAVDRQGGTRTLRGLFASSILAAVVFAAAGSLWTLLLGALFAGVALAFANPVTNRLIAVSVPSGERGWIMGAKQSGVQVGALIAGSLLPAVALAFTWRVGYLVLGMVPIIGWILARSAPEDIGARGNVESGPSPGEYLKMLGPTLSAPLIRWLSLYSFFMGAGVGAMAAYLPLYALQDLGLSFSAAGWTAGVVGIVGVVARLLWGRVSEAVQRTAPLLVAVAALSVASVVLLLLAATLGTWSLWLGVGLFGATGSSWNVIAMMTVLRRVSDDELGRATGVLQLSFTFGLAVSPVAFAWLADRSTYSEGWASLAIYFAIATALAVGWWRRGEEPSSEDLRTATA